jgi:cytidyltransferase-like protein
VQRAAEIIVASKWNKLPDDALTWRFWEADCKPLATDYPLASRVAYERAIFREYQWASWTTYREKRAEFLRDWSNKFSQQREGVEICLGLLEGLSPRVAVYPGSFNPFHRGHLSILRQAERVFDKVIIGVAVNRQKSGAVDTLEARRAELQARVCFHEVAGVPGLLTDIEIQEILSQILPRAHGKPLRSTIEVQGTEVTVRRSQDGQSPTTAGAAFRYRDLRAHRTSLAGHPSLDSSRRRRIRNRLARTLGPDHRHRLESPGDRSRRRAHCRP